MTTPTESEKQRDLRARKRAARAQGGEVAHG